MRPLKGLTEHIREKYMSVCCIRPYFLNYGCSMSSGIEREYTANIRKIFSVSDEEKRYFAVCAYGIPYPIRNSVLVKKIAVSNEENAFCPFYPVCSIRTPVCSIRRSLPMRKNGLQAMLCRVPISFLYDVNTIVLWFKAKMNHTYLPKPFFNDLMTRYSC